MEIYIPSLAGQVFVFKELKGCPGKLSSIRKGDNSCTNLKINDCAYLFFFRA